MTVLAHSAACTMALVYAAAHLIRLQALILVGPSRWLYKEIEDDTEEILHRRSGEPWYPSAVAQERSNHAPEPDEIPALLSSLAPASYARWGEREQAHAAMARSANWEATRLFWKAKVDGHELRARLALVAASVLIITGELDTATGVNPGDAWARCFPDGRHLTIAGSGHNPRVDQPEIFAHLVTEFLSMNETQSGSSSDALGV